MTVAAAVQLDPAKPREQSSPPVTAADDRDWFATRPARRYRVRRAERGFWIVRKRSGGVFLRAWAPALPKGLPDADKALRVLWYSAAWPDLSPPERAELVRAARAANA